MTTPNYQKLIPLSDKVIVEPFLVPDKVGEIFVVTNEAPTQGKVVAVGPGRMSEHGVRIPLNVKVGDVVVFNQYSASKIKIDGHEVNMLSENDINCIVKS